MKEFLIGMLGDQNPEVMKFMFSWAIVGALTWIFVDGLTRNPATKYSPVKFSALYFLKDNMMRLFATLLCLIIAVRFSVDIFGIEPNMLNGLAIGLVSDFIPWRIKSWRAKLIASQKLQIETTMNIGFPTIGPTDILTGTSNFGTFSSPGTMAQLVASDNRFFIAQDEDGTDILCSQKAAGDPLPTISGTDSSSTAFLPQPAEEFIGPRPPRFRPR